MAKKILSVSDNDALRITRHMMLENKGFEVMSVANLRELCTTLKSGGFDLVILGVSIDGTGKREMAANVRRLCEPAQILELCRISPEVPDAEYHLISAEPADIDQAVCQILLGDKIER